MVLQRLLDVLVPGRERTLRGPGRWWLAVVAVPVAALVSASAGKLAGIAAAPFAPFYISLVVVASWAGAGPGMLALGLSVLAIAVASNVVFGNDWAVLLNNGVGLFVYVVAGLLIVAVCHQLNRARAQLQDSLERLTLVQSDVGIGLWTLDLATRQLRTSESGWRLHGRDVPRLAGRAVEHDAWLSVVHPDDRAGMVAHLDAAIASGEGRYEHEFRVPLPDGSTRWINVFVKIHRDQRRSRDAPLGRRGRRHQHARVAPGARGHRGAAADHQRLAADADRLCDARSSLPLQQPRLRDLVRHLAGIAGRPPDGGRARRRRPTPACKPHLDRAFAGETARFRSRLDYVGGSGRATSPAPTCRTSSTARCRAW